MTRFFTIVNPKAGGGRCGEGADALLARLRDGGVQLEVHRTSGPGDATDLARRAYTDGERSFLAVGGDGTTFEVLNGIFPRPEGDTDPVILGILPFGTGNSFLRDFRITDQEGALQNLLRGERATCDVVEARHRDGVVHSLNILSVGFSARAGALTNAKYKGIGALGYVLAVVQSLAGLEHPTFPLRIDDGPLDERPTTLLSFSNSKFTGGTMMMAPAANVTDGKVDVIRVGKLGRLGLLAAFPRIFQGTHVSLPSVETSHAKKISFDRAVTTPVMIDGEVLDLALEEITVLPGALQVVAPREALS